MRSHKSLVGVCLSLDVRCVQISPQELKHAVGLVRDVGNMFTPVEVTADVNSKVFGCGSFL